MDTDHCHNRNHRKDHIEYLGIYYILPYRNMDIEKFHSVYDEFNLPADTNSCIYSGNLFNTIIKVTIPQGNLCGIYSSWNGGGSLMEMKLLNTMI